MSLSKKDLTNAPLRLVLVEFVNNASTLLTQAEFVPAIQHRKMTLLIGPGNSNREKSRGKSKIETV
jgi:hypothetical protein